MTREETIEMMAILKAAYPNSYNGMTKQEALGVVSVWHLHFEDVPADVVFMAMQKAISASKFPPSINEVKLKLQDVYWDAFEALDNQLIPLLPAERAAIQRVYEAAKPYKMARMAEPRVQQMLYSSPHAGQELAEGPAAGLPGRR